MGTQLITPNPDIPCQPGWCLQYVRQTYGLAGVHPTATAAWNASRTQHHERAFPDGCWVPVWFTLADEPAGHVALRSPDGSVYSTSDLATVPHHHPSLDDLLNYYAYYGHPLTYLGWTEDIEGVAVIDAGSINFQSTTTTTQEDDMPLSDDDVLRVAKATVAILMTEQHGGNTLGEMISEERQHYLDVLHASTNPRIDANQAEDIVQATVARVPSAVVNFNYRPGANISGALDAIAAKPAAAAGAVTNVVADPEAVVRALAFQLNK